MQTVAKLNRKWKLLTASCTTLASNEQWCKHNLHSSKMLHVSCGHILLCIAFTILCNLMCNMLCNMQIVPLCIILNNLHQHYPPPLFLKLWLSKDDFFVYSFLIILIVRYILKQILVNFWVKFKQNLANGGHNLFQQIRGEIYNRSGWFCGCVSDFSGKLRTFVCYPKKHFCVFRN